MKVLLAGAAGQLGRSLQAVMTRHDLVALDRSRLDIGSLTAVREAVAAHAPDIVINAAAFNEVDAAQVEREAAFRGNALGPRNLAVATAERRAAILHVSTDYVFDGTSLLPYHEFSRTNPLSVYGQSKLAGEEAVRVHNRRHYIVRTAWLYHAEGKNFPKTILGHAGNTVVRVVSDQYGSPTYTPHLAEAIVRLIDTAAYGTYHLAGRGGTSWFELTRTLYRHAGITTPVEPIATADFPRPAPRPRYAVLTTVQDPQLLLPPWESGVAAFARALGTDSR